jgi:hypothetical protein
MAKVENESATVSYTRGAAFDVLGIPKTINERAGTNIPNSKKINLPLLL